MKQLTVTKQVRLSKEIAHYLDVLYNVYGINPSAFIRSGIVEKIKRDIPELRRKHREKDLVKPPFWCCKTYQEVLTILIKVLI